MNLLRCFSRALGKSEVGGSCLSSSARTAASSSATRPLPAPPPALDTAPSSFSVSSSFLSAFTKPSSTAYAAPSVASRDMEMRVSFSLSMVVAVVLAEIVNFLMYNQNRPWGRNLGDRYLITSVVCDIILVIILRSVLDSVWSVRTLEDAVVMALLFTLVFTCLEAPHYIHCSSSFSHFVFHALHKTVIILVMVLSLVFFKY